MARVLVGLPALVGDIAKYKDRFDLVELRPVDTSVPKERTLRAYRKAVPPAFVFSVVMPRIVGELGTGPDVDAAIEQCLAVATAVEARCLVVATPPSVRPTSANKKRIEALLARVRRDGVVTCWEPSGLWERDEIVESARALDVVPVLDAARESLGGGPIAYTRLRGLGQGVVIGAKTVERIAERLAGRREAFVVVEGADPAHRLRAALASAMLGVRPKVRAAVSLKGPPIASLVAEDEEQ